MVAIGDKIRFIGRYGTDLRIGTTYPVVDVDKNSEISNVCVIDDVNERNWIGCDEFEIVEAADELQELRDWKVAALARFPALAEPESDAEAAERFAERSYEIGREEAFLEALAWARANPR